MKPSLKTVILVAGGLNLLMGIFHVYLCYRFHVVYSGMSFYPLLQMFAVGGAMMVFFLAVTSLFFPVELVTTKIGRSVIVLNLLVYFSRIVEEFVLVPVSQPAIIGACLLPGVLYAYLLLYGMNGQARTEFTT